jgi:hypothetical protein
MLALAHKKPIQEDGGEETKGMKIFLASFASWRFKILFI